MTVEIKMQSKRKNITKMKRKEKLTGKNQNLNQNQGGSLGHLCISYIGSLLLLPCPAVVSGTSCSTIVFRLGAVADFFRFRAGTIPSSTSVGACHFLFRLSSLHRAVKAAFCSVPINCSTLRAAAVGFTSVCAAASEAFHATGCLIRHCSEVIVSFRRFL